MTKVLKLARNLTITFGGALIVFALLGVLLSACESESEPTTPPAKVAPKAPVVPEEKTEEPTEAPAGKAELPSLVGVNLQDAQDTAQAAGFYNLNDKDASGMDRFNVLDSNWTVCSQEPGAGTMSTDTLVTFSAVKVGESCP